MLYGSINKMRELELIEESDDRLDPHLDDERRRYYRITNYGRKVAQAEAARMRELAQLAAGDVWTAQACLTHLSPSRFIGCC